MSEQIDGLSTEVDEVSMDDTIRQTLAEIESRGNESEQTEQAGEAEPTESETESSGPVRDEKGRFAPKSEPEQVAEPGQTEEVAEAESQPVTVPPELQKLGLRKEEAEAFAKASPEVQAAFIRRSEEMHRGFEQFRSKAQFGDAMERVIAPYMPLIQQAGVTPDQAVAHLLRAESVLRAGSQEQKQQAFAQLARDYGVDLGQTAEFAANQPQLPPEVINLQQEVQRMRAFVEQQNQAREWQEREQLNSEIARFAQDPAHAHFEEVRNEMAGLLQAGLAPDLNTAYEMAIYANPTIRARVLDRKSVV